MSQVTAPILLDSTGQDISAKLQAIANAINGGTIDPLSVTQNGTYTPSGTTLGYGPVTVNVGGGGANIQPLLVTQNGIYTASGSVDGYSPVYVLVEPIKLKTVATIGTYTFLSDGIYAVCAAIDGSSSSVISYTANGPTILKEETQKTINSSWSGSALGLVCSASSGDTITVTGTSVARSVMTIVDLSVFASGISNISLSVGKDNPATMQKTIDGNYVFCAVGTTGSNAPSASITQTGLTAELYNEASSPVTIHKCGAYVGNGTIDASASGSSYSTNYIMMVEFTLSPQQS